MSERASTSQALRCHSAMHEPATWTQATGAPQPVERPGLRSIAVAARGKGRLRFVRPAGVIATRYGVGPGRMARRIATLAKILERCACSATLPISASAARRHPSVVRRFADGGIEFAAHGPHHVDHSETDGAGPVADLEGGPGAHAPPCEPSVRA